MSNGKVVLYITFIDFNASPTSGSSVRPMRMYDAFLQRGYEVKLLAGAGNQSKIRKKNVSEIREWLKLNRPDFCYIEPPSGPLFFHCDRALIEYLHKLRVPIGFFYRDLYWRFPVKDFENKRRIDINWLKHQVITRMQHRDFRLVKKNVDQIYFTSSKCNDFMRLDKFGLLPPGCVEGNNGKKGLVNDTAIYVGGATVRYGLGLVLDSCIAVSKRTKIFLNIVCPEKQWLSWIDDFPQYRDLPDWVHIYHIGDGVELEKLYLESDFALVPILRTEYNDLALPIKLFEYISRFLPVVSTDCDAIKEFLEPYNIGLVVEDNVSEYSEAIFNILTERENYYDYQKNMENALRENLWTKRIDKIADDLGIGRENE